eukprot:gene2369-3098_t
MDAHVTCNNTLMQGNEARIYGGGISVKGLSNLSITRSNVINNIAGMDGGALFLYASSEATVSNCTFAMNEGAQGGAIALLHHAKVAIFSHSTITTSRSTSHGGAISIIDLSLAVISNTMFFNNRAEGYGGHVHLKSSNVMMTDCILQISRADLAGGAIHARSSMLNITRADIHKAVSQLGAGLDLQHSTAVLKQVSLSRCLGAVEGGGGLVRANSSLEMIDCQVMSCGGGREMQCHGGGLAVQDAGSLLVSNSKFMGNSAYSGAGVYITSMPAFLDISNVVFEYGNSTIGGGIAMSIPLYDTPFLQDIRFVNNTATLGPCVFWLYEEDANFVEPECKNCSSTSIPIMATSGVRETVFSDGVDLSESFIILDYYNASVTLIEEQDTQVVVYANDPAWVSGTFSENYVTDEGGVFDELVVHGDPGTTIRMVFRMQSSAEVIVNVSLRVCESGEVYDESIQSCTACEAGYIKFDNTSSACTDCGDYSYAVKCLGGSSFEVLQGAWLAPNTVHCDDTPCFFDRLYECLASKACTNNENALRIASSFLEVSNLELCNTEMYYSSGVMCGGGDPVICATNHIWFLDSTTCVECPELWASLASCLLFIVVALTLLYFIYRLFSALKRQYEMDETNLEMASEINSLMQASGAISLMAGYVQGGVGVDTMQAVTMPWAILFGFSLVYNVIIMRNISSKHEQARSKSTHEAEVLMMRRIGGGKLPKTLTDEVLRRRNWERSVWISCANGTLFLMMQVHPEVGIILFQLMQCVPYYHDDEDGDVQYWLKSDISVQCFTQQWIIGTVIASLMLLIFVAGLPATLMWQMSRLRRKVKEAVDEYENWLETMMETRIKDKENIAEDRGPITDLTASESGWRAISLYATPKSYEDLGKQNHKLPNEMITQWAANFNKEKEDYHLRLCADITPEQIMRPTELNIHGIGRVQAAMWEKADYGDRGRYILAPFTMLDGSHDVFGHLTDNFEDAFYFWQCYEVVRRLMQTGVVVVVESIAGPTMAAAFGLLVAFVALLLHMKFSPYVNDQLDRLMSAILINQVAFQFYMVIVIEKDENDKSADWICYLLLLLNAGVVFVAATVILPILVPSTREILNDLDRLCRSNSSSIVSVNGASETIDVVKRLQSIRTCTGPRANSDINTVGSVTKNEEAAENISWENGTEHSQLLALIPEVNGTESSSSEEVETSGSDDSDDSNEMARGSITQLMGSQDMSQNGFRQRPYIPSLNLENVTRTIMLENQNRAARDNLQSVRSDTSGTSDSNEGHEDDDVDSDYDYDEDDNKAIRFTRNAEGSRSYLEQL